MKFACVAQAAVLLIATMLGCLLVVGCAKTEQHEDTQRLRLLSTYYSQYRGHHQGRLAADERDLKQFIAANGADALSRAGIASVDELFASTRDGKPFVVKYRGDRSWPLPEAVAYETEGRDGIRFIATPGGGVGEISDEEFRSKVVASSAATK